MNKSKMAGQLGLLVLLSGLMLAACSHRTPTQRELSGTAPLAGGQTAEPAPAATLAEAWLPPRIERRAPRGLAEERRVAGVRNGTGTFFVNGWQFSVEQTANARHHYEGVVGRELRSVEELIPYLFTWPAAAPDRLTPAPRRDPGALLQRGKLSPDLLPAQAAVGLGVVADALQMVLPTPLPEDEQFQYQDRLPVFRFPELFSEGRIEAPPAIAGEYPAALLTELNIYKRQCAYLPDLRRFLLLDAFEGLLHKAAWMANELPADFDTMRRWSGCTLINVDACPPDDADLLAETVIWNGERVFRIRLRLESGHELDRVVYYTKLNPSTTSHSGKPFREVDPHRTQAWEPFAAVRLAEHPTLPSLISAEAEPVQEVASKPQAAPKG